MEQYFRNRTQVSDPDLLSDRRANDGRLKSRFEHIFAKYEKDFTGVGDEIDLESGEVVVNNGHLENMRHEVDPGKGTGAQLVRAFAEGLENESEESTSEDGEGEGDGSNESTPDAESKEDSDSTSSSGYTSSGIITDHGEASSRSTPVDQDELSSDIYPDLADGLSRGKKRKRKTPPTSTGDREGSKLSQAGTTSNDISRSATPADVAHDLLENLPFLKESMRAMQEGSKQSGGLDQNAIQALGQSIANQLAQYVADGPNRTLAQPQLQQPAPRLSRWDYPKLPGDERRRTPTPPPQPLSSSAALFSMSPGGGASLWAPVQYPRARKKRRTHQSSRLALDPALESDGEDPLHSDSPHHTPFRTLTADDETQLLSEMEATLPDGPSRSCYNCGETDTPNFRRGPDGDVCNACGMYYYRYGLMRPLFDPEPSPPRPEPEPGTFSVLVPPGHDISQADLAEFDIPITPVSNGSRDDGSYKANTGRRIVAGGARISRFTKEEDEIIIKCREVDDLPWEVIGRLVSGRSALAVQTRYSSELRQNPSEARSSLLEQGYRVKRLEPVGSEADVIMPDEGQQNDAMPEDENTTVSMIDPSLLNHVDDAGPDSVTFFMYAGPPARSTSHADRDDGVCRVPKRFTEEEDQLIKKLRDEDKLTWEKVQEQIPGRTLLSLQKHYRRELVPKRLQAFDENGNIDLETFELKGLRNIRYSEEEDELIRKMKEEEKMSFAEMTEFLIGRTEDSLANRYSYMKAHNAAMAKATPSLDISGPNADNDDSRLTVGEMFGLSAYTGNVHSPYRTSGDSATPPAQSSMPAARYGAGALARNRESLKTGLPVAALRVPQTPAASTPQTWQPPRRKQVGPAAWDATQPTSKGPLPFQPTRKGPRHPQSASKKPAQPDPFASKRPPLQPAPQHVRPPPPTSIPIHVLLQKPLPVFSPPMTQKDKEMMSFVPHLHIMPSQIAHSTLFPSQILCIPPRPKKAAYGSYKAPSEKRAYDHTSTPARPGETYIYTKQPAPAGSVQPQTSTQHVTPVRMRPIRPFPPPFDDSDDDEIIFMGSKPLPQPAAVAVMRAVGQDSAKAVARSPSSIHAPRRVSMPVPQSRPVPASPHTPMAAPSSYPRMSAARSALMRPPPRNSMPTARSTSAEFSVSRPASSSKSSNVHHAPPMMSQGTDIAKLARDNSATAVPRYPGGSVTSVPAVSVNSAEDDTAAPLSAFATTQQSPPEFTNAEDRLIKRWREKDGCCWSEIATRLPHRTQQAVTDRYYNVIIGKATAARAAAAAANAATRDPSDPKYDQKYTVVESDLILELKAQGLSFAEMAVQLPGRTAESIQKHFHGSLSTTKTSRKEQTPNRLQQAQTPLLRQALSNSTRRGSVPIEDAAPMGYSHFTLKPPRTRSNMPPYATTPSQQRPLKSQNPEAGATYPSSPPVDSAISLGRHADLMDYDDDTPFITQDDDEPDQSNLEHPKQSRDHTAEQSTFINTTPSPPANRRSESAEYNTSMYPETPLRTVDKDPYFRGTTPELAPVYETPARFNQQSMPYFVAPSARMVSPELEQSRSTTPVADLLDQGIDPDLARSPVDPLMEPETSIAKKGTPKPKAVPQRRQPSTRKGSKRRRGDEDDTDLLAPIETAHASIEKKQVKPKQSLKRSSKRRSRVESDSEPLMESAEETPSAEEEEADSPRRSKRRPKKRKLQDGDSDTSGESPPPGSDSEDYAERTEAGLEPSAMSDNVVRETQQNVRGRKRQKSSPGSAKGSWAEPWIQLITEAIKSTTEKRMLSRDVLQWIRDNNETHRDTRDWEPNVRRALTLKHVFTKIDIGQPMHYWTLNGYAEANKQQLLTPTSVSASDPHIKDIVVDNPRDADSDSDTTSIDASEALKQFLNPPEVADPKTKTNRKRTRGKHSEYVRVISLALASTSSGRMQSKDIITWIRDNVEGYRDFATLDQTIRTTLSLGQEFTKIALESSGRRCEWKLSDATQTAELRDATGSAGPSSGVAESNMRNANGGDDELSGDEPEHAVAAVTLSIATTSDPSSTAASSIHSVGSVNFAEGKSTANTSLEPSAPGHDDKTTVASARPFKSLDPSPERPEHAFAVPAAIRNDKKHRHSDPTTRLGGPSARRSMTPLRSARKPTPRASRASTPRFEAIRRGGGPLEALGRRASSVQPAFSRAGSVALPSGRRIVMAQTVGVNEQSGDEDELA